MLAGYIYVMYRSQHPDKATEQQVLKELQEYNIDVSQLVYWPADQCQKAESSTEKEVPHRDSGVGNGTQPSAILNIQDH